ncbi:Sip1-related alpha-galactosidase [Paenibacillus oryzisoli]|uniref:Sip1-related alpha-galactosidase n=1 Tax=Paenibacillus oryzisoli TaxID=1850517 RepID=UPI003D2808BC
MMFTYQNLTLFAGSGAPVLRGFGLTVSLVGETPKRLTFQACEHVTGTDKHEAFEEYTLRFQDEAEPATVSATFRLRCCGDTVLGFVDAQVLGGPAFMSRRSFAPVKGVAVTVEEMNDVQGLMANYQHNEWWTRPHFGSDVSQLPERTISLLWRTEDAYFRLLPVCGPEVRADVTGGGGEEGAGFSVGLSSHRGGLQRTEALAFVLGGGADPYALAERTTDAALLALNGPAILRKGKTYPEVLDYLGWCSWDAFYQKVDEQGVLAKAAEFNALGVPVRWVMIDDGWSTTADGKLLGFEADAAKFPEGLGHTARRLKEQHGIRWVGVWHTIAGYWCGIHPLSVMAAELRPYLYATPDGSLIPYPDPALGFGFWNAWHGYLRRQGIDFVKVDSQAAIGNFMQYDKTIGAAASATHQALEASTALHFDKRMINCMGLAAENIWHRPASAVSRNSDDFMPRSQHGFREHALQNAYNSFYHGPFYWGDWDMFWTMNHDDLQNAVLRAISGGPVYISDPLERTDPAKLLPLTYRDGKLLRCDQPAVPTLDGLLRDPTRELIPLKLWNTAGSAGLVAAFHIAETASAVQGTVSAEDVPALAGQRVALYEHFSQTCRVLEAGEAFPFDLQPEACKLFLLAPLSSDVTGVTPLGLADKFASSHALIQQSRLGDADVVRLREGGKFLFYAPVKPELVLVNEAERQAAVVAEGFYEVDCSEQPGEVVVKIACK